MVLETWRFTFKEVSYEALVLETWRFTFEGSLVRNARFGDLALLLEEVSNETLLLETWRFTCGAGLRPGQFVVQMQNGKELFLVQKLPVCSANVVRERVFRSWTQ